MTVEAIGFYVLAVTFFPDKTRSIYDADGNLTYGPLGGSMVTYQYDSRNRLSAAGNTEYTYDANGNRVEVDDNGDITRYVVNPNAALSQILMETDENGVVQSYYIYGIGLIGKENATTDDYYSYHFDSRGSTVALSDETGAVTDRYNYGPYGEIIQRSGTTENIFLYVGQYGVVTDANGLYQMRARYYNPEIKCFINEDDLVGSVENSQSLNRYAYANGNPILYVDPFGHAPEGSQSNNRVLFTISSNQWHTDRSLDNRKYLHWQDGKYDLRFNSDGKLVEHNGKVIGDPIGRESKILEKLMRAVPEFFSGPKSFIPMFYIPIDINKFFGIDPA